MDRTLVFDTGVLQLHLAGDDRVNEFVDAMSRGRSHGLVTGVNLAEFYHHCCQRLGKQTADNLYFQVIESGLSVAGSEELNRLAGLEKCRHTGLALADCFALALAKRENALLLTTDSELAKVKEVRARLFPV